MTFLRAHSVTQNGQLSLWTADNVQDKLLWHKTSQKKQYSLPFSTVQGIFYCIWGSGEGMASLSRDWMGVT